MRSLPLIVEIVPVPTQEPANWARLSPRCAKAAGAAATATVAAAAKQAKRIVFGCLSTERSDLTESPKFVQTPHPLPAGLI
jgi:hypothetical protein